jgi:hypothetical protein
MQGGDWALTLLKQKCVLATLRVSGRSCLLVADHSLLLLLLLLLLGGLGMWHAWERRENLQGFGGKARRKETTWKTKA